MGNRMNVFGKGQGLDGDATTTGATCLSSLPQARQDRRGILRQGDVTTACPRCGENGTIIEGERRMKFHGLPVAVDGALLHCACPAGSNRLIAPLGALSGAKQAAAPRSATNAVPASAASRATPLTPSSSAFAGAPPGTLEPGFYIVPRSMSWPQLLARLTDEQGPQLITRLQRLNPTYLDGFKAGEIVVIGDPDNFTACTRKEADLMAAAAQVRETLAQLTDEEANFMMRYQGEIAGMLGMASLSMGVGVDMLNKGLKQVEDTLRSLELLHQREFNRHGHLKSPDFFTARRQLYQQLDAQLKSAFLNKQLNLGSYNTLRRDLRISTKSLVHHWSRAGGAGQIPGYATHLDEVAKTAKYLKYGGYVGIALGGGIFWSEGARGVSCWRNGRVQKG